LTLDSHKKALYKCTLPYLVLRKSASDFTTLWCYTNGICIIIIIIIIITAECPVAFGRVTTMQLVTRYVCPSVCRNRALWWHDRQHSCRLLWHWNPGNRTLCPQGIMPPVRMPSWTMCPHIVRGHSDPGYIGQGHNVRDSKPHHHQLRLHVIHFSDG